MRPFVFFLFFFLSICPGLLFSSRLLMVPEAPCALYFAVTFSLFSSLVAFRDPQGLLYNPFGLGLVLSSVLSSLVLGLSLFFLGLIFTVIF